LNWDTLTVEKNGKQHGIVRQFKTGKSLHDFLFSFVDFFNKNVDEWGIKQQIKSLEKHYLSNQWGSPRHEFEVQKQIDAEIETKIREANRIGQTFELTDMEKAHYKYLKDEAKKLDEQEAAKNRNDFTKYQLSFIKHDDKIIVRADVQEFGVVYVLTNYWENKYCDAF
jgi:hypothetical protein